MNRPLHAGAGQPDFRPARGGESVVGAGCERGREQTYMEQVCTGRLIVVELAGFQILEDIPLAVFRRVLAFSTLGAVDDTRRTASLTDFPLPGARTCAYNPLLKDTSRPPTEDPF